MARSERTSPSTRDDGPCGAKADEFGDSIASALERLLAATPATAAVPVGTRLGIELCPSGESDEAPDGERTSRTVTGAAVDASPVMQAVSTTDAETMGVPDVPVSAPVASGGMAVWEGTPSITEGGSPFSERPSTPIARTDESRALPTLAPSASSVDLEPTGPLTAERELASDAMRDRSTRPEELWPGTRDRSAARAGFRGELDGAGKSTRGVELAKWRPPSREEVASSQRRGEALRTESSRHRRGQERSEGDLVLGSLDARSGRTPDGAYVALELHRGSSLTTTVSHEVAALDEGAPATPANEPPTHVVTRLGDHRARVELVHPELGRVEVEVTTVESRVDVELLARSLGASIALRASEGELRSDLRQRATQLRNYRVRTAARGAGVEEEDWR